MNPVKAVVWKEARHFARDKKMLASLCFVTLVIIGFSYYSMSRNVLFDPIRLAISIQFVSIYILSITGFYKERLNKTLASLLATHITVRQLFIAKSIAIFLFSYAFQLVSVAALSGLYYYHNGVFPEATVVCTCLITIPAWGFVLATLLGILLSVVGSIDPIRIIAVVIIIVTTLNARGELSISIPLFFILLSSAIIACLMISVLLKKVSRQILIEHL